MPEEELRVLQKYYTKLSQFAKSQQTLTESHSIDEQHKEHAIREELDKELGSIGQRKDLARNEPDDGPTGAT